MPTKTDADDDLLIEVVGGLDWSRAENGRRDGKPADRTEVCLDGAVEYQLRLIPSTKIIPSMTTTPEPSRS